MLVTVYIGIIRIYDVYLPISPIFAGICILNRRVVTRRIEPQNNRDAPDGLPSRYQPHTTFPNISDPSKTGVSLETGAFNLVFKRNTFTLISTRRNVVIWHFIDRNLNVRYGTCSFFYGIRSRTGKFYSKLFKPQEESLTLTIKRKHMDVKGIFVYLHKKTYCILSPKKKIEQRYWGQKKVQLQ